jgi:hypothetical protein
MSRPDAKHVPAEALELLRQRLQRKHEEARSEERPRQRPCAAIGAPRANSRSPMPHAGGRYPATETHRCSIRAAH